MKRGLFLVATVTLSSALYAQQILTREAVEEVFAQYNPQLMVQAGKQPALEKWLNAAVTTYAGQQLPDTLENRATLVALARNFENSILLDTVTQQYQRTLLYARMGDASAAVGAREFARDMLSKIYARIWAVSVQVKEDLLVRYEQQRRVAALDKNLTAAQRQALREHYQQAGTEVRAELKRLHTAPGLQVQHLTAQALEAAEMQVQAALTVLQAEQTDNLQIKTNHKKPTAE